MPRSSKKSHDDHQGRPLKEDKKRIRVSFTLHPEDEHWLKRQASRQNITKSELLDRLIRQYRRLFMGAAGEKLPEFCRNRGIKKLLLFGSVLTSRFTPQSDVDVLVEFVPEKKVTLFEVVAVEKELASILGVHRVDLRTMDELSPYFRKEVLQKAQELYRAA